MSNDAQSKWDAAKGQVLDREEAAALSALTGEDVVSAEELTAPAAVPANEKLRRNRATKLARVFRGNEVVPEVRNVRASQPEQDSVPDKRAKKGRGPVIYVGKDSHEASKARMAGKELKKPSARHLQTKAAQNGDAIHQLENAGIDHGEAIRVVDAKRGSRASRERQTAGKPRQVMI